MEINNLGYYIKQIIIGLIIAQLLSSTSNSINFLGLVLIVIQSIIIFYYLKDHFLFIIYLFSLCLIYTLSKLGGIVLAPFIIFIGFILVPGRFSVKDKLIKFCLIILVLTNFLGSAFKNQAEIFEIFQSAIIFSGFILTYIFIYNFKFTLKHINIILKVFTFLSILLFLVAFNQKFVFVDTSFPLLGSTAGYQNVSSLSEAFGGRMPSLLGDYELFSEFALLMFIISFSVMLDTRITAALKFDYVPYILAFVSFLNILITGTRSSFLLIFIFILIFFLLRLKILFSTRTAILLIAIAMMIPIFIRFGDKVGMNIIIERLNEINTEKIGVKNITTGEEMNREIVYLVGYNRLDEENWFLGYGYGTTKANRLAWFGSNVSLPIVDFHSLYLCIPMIYGWFGGFAYLLLVVYTIIILIKKILLSKDNPLNSLMLGFAFMFLFFLVNQMKINSLRIYNYHYLIWMLMGLAASIASNEECIEEIEAKNEDSLVY